MDAKCGLREARMSRFGRSSDGLTCRRLRLGLLLRKQPGLNGRDRGSEPQLAGDLAIQTADAITDRFLAPILHGSLGLFCCSPQCAYRVEHGLQADRGRPGKAFLHGGLAS